MHCMFEPFKEKKANDINISETRRINLLPQGLHEEFYPVLWEIEKVTSDKPDGQQLKNHTILIAYFTFKAIILLRSYYAYKDPNFGLKIRHNEYNFGCFLDRQFLIFFKISNGKSFIVSLINKLQNFIRSDN